MMRRQPVMIAAAPAALHDHQPVPFKFAHDVDRLTAGNADFVGECRVRRPCGRMVAPVLSQPSISQLCRLRHVTTAEKPRRDRRERLALNAGRHHAAALTSRPSASCRVAGNARRGRRRSDAPPLPRRQGMTARRARISAGDSSGLAGRWPCPTPTGGRCFDSTGVSRRPAFAVPRQPLPKNGLTHATDTGNADHR